MTLRQRWDWLIGPVLALLFVGGIWLCGLALARGLKVVVWDDPPTHAARRYARIASWASSTS